MKLRPYLLIVIMLNSPFLCRQRGMQSRCYGVFLMLFCPVIPWVIMFEIFIPVENFFLTGDLNDTPRLLSTIEHVDQVYPNSTK